jgi:hypothetical protein
MENPISPSPLTQSPITEPPLKAIFSAAERPDSFAALAVRELDAVAVSMPNFPASMEQTAPVRKAVAVAHEMAKPSKTASTTTKMARILYSA